MGKVEEVLNDHADSVTGGVVSYRLYRLESLDGLSAIPNGQIT